MSTQITILGLGQIGASIGLALGHQPEGLVRVGHDREVASARAAESKGAVDRISLNLPASVEKANLIILALPQDEIRPTMQVIGSDLRPGTIVMDTAPSKAAVLAIMEEFLPKTCSYVGLLPVMGPAYLHGLMAGAASAREDLFEKSLIGIIAPAGTPAVALQAAADLVDQVRADKMFMDQTEADSIMAGVHVLPGLLGAALLGITTDRGGWQEGKKLAGRPYAMATAPQAAESGAALAHTAISSQEHTLRHLRNMIATLESYASLVAAEDTEALEDKLMTARLSYYQWREERDLGSWMAEELAPPSKIPTSNEWIGRFFGFQPRYQKRK